MLTRERLKYWLEYNQNTGLFTYIRSPNTSIKIGVEAGHIDDKGYHIIKIDKINYRAHRAAWLYMTGEWPINQIDHINQIKNDNRWNNLREANNSQNLRNIKAHKDNQLGVKGIHIYRGKYKVQIQVNKKKIFLGCFDTLEEAKSAFVAAAIKYHGEYHYV